MSTEQPKPTSGQGRPSRSLGSKRNSVGLTFGAAIVVFTLAGWWLDDRFGTSPALVLVGFGIGAVGGFIHLVETVSPGTLFKSRRKAKN